MDTSKSSGKILNFSKYQGAGDHFVFVNNTRNEYAFLTDNQDLVSRLLDVSYGVGGNALIELLPSPGYDYYMNYYNMDGTRGAMCGNGSRCSAIFAYKENIIKKRECHFQACDGPHTAKIITKDSNKGLVEVRMKDVDHVDTVNDSTDYFIDVGTPHYIKFVDSLKTYPVLKEGPLIRNLDEYQNIDGTNANFAEWIENGDGHRRLHLRTYERGVHGEILACGTASVAAALVAHWRDFQLGKKQSQSEGTNNKNENTHVTTEVVMPGDSLFVKFQVDEQCRFSNVWLRGPAKEVFTGQMIVE